MQDPTRKSQLWTTNDKTPQWVMSSKVYNFADDTSSSLAHRNLDMLLKLLEKDAEAILKFMASNGLVANCKKTVFMLLNFKNEVNETIKIRVGKNEIAQEKSTKLLGMTIEDNQNWKEHFSGKNGLISTLNKRLFAIRRVANFIPNDKLIQLAHAIWMSKLRYGLQLCSYVRIVDSDLKNANMKAAQIAQNKLLRLLNNSTLKDKVSTVKLLENTGMLSVNQLAASIKIAEVWKSLNVEDYPIRLEPNHCESERPERTVRPGTTRLWNQDARTSAEKESFSRSAAKLWNSLPTEIKNTKTLFSAKKAIKAYCKLLPS